MTTQWDQVIGHEWAAQLLAGSITHQRTGHAYLLTGPDQIGKTTLARTFAQALNCTAADPAARPCGLCRSCQLIAANRHPDVRLITPEVSGRGKLTLKIDEIRALQQALNLAAYEARTKVAILKRFDTATEGAANAFLKTLEEPPRNVVLLLTANDADTMLATINSRCRTIALRPLPARLIEDSLQSRWQVPEDKAYLLSHLADGRLGWAIRAYEDATILSERQQNLDYLQQALAGDRADRFALADKLGRKPELLPEILQTWLSWWRDVTLLSQGENGRDLALTNVDQQAEVSQAAQNWTAEQALSSLQQTQLAIRQLQRNANTRLVVEILFLTYPFA
ncbi:MAG: DNA polymerase III subunit delta' [Chloroflexi bacterium]|nr:DNA polymerase III subunit delta' [Chloroflexota bacterium]